jgi:hypothetical protein
LRKNRDDKPAIEAELKRLWATRFAALGPEHDLKVRRDRQRHFLLEIDALLTPAQRTHAVAHLNEQIGKLQRWALAPAES